MDGAGKFPLPSILEAKSWTGRANLPLPSILEAKSWTGR